MTEVLYANVFFFITGIAVIVISVILVILLFHVIKTLKSVRRILNTVERGTEAISDDMQSVREYFAKGGLIGGVISLLRGDYSFSRKTKKKIGQKSRSKRKSRTELKIKDVTR